MAHDRTTGPDENIHLALDIGSEEEGDVTLTPLGLVTDDDEIVTIADEFDSYTELCFSGLRKAPVIDVLVTGTIKRSGELGSCPRTYRIDETHPPLAEHNASDLGISAGQYGYFHVRRRRFAGKCDGVDVLHVVCVIDTQTLVTPASRLIFHLFVLVLVLWKVASSRSPYQIDSFFSNEIENKALV